MHAYIHPTKILVPVFLYYLRFSMYNSRTRAREIDRETQINEQTDGRLDVHRRRVSVIREAIYLTLPRASRERSVSVWKGEK